MVLGKEDLKINTVSYIPLRKASMMSYHSLVTPRALSGPLDTTLVEPSLSQAHKSSYGRGFVGEA